MSLKSSTLAVAMRRSAEASLARIEAGVKRLEGYDQSRLAPCKRCPTALNDAAGTRDEESADMLARGFAEPFYCAWRPGVWCVAWKAKCPALSPTPKPEGTK